MQFLQKSQNKNSLIHAEVLGATGSLRGKPIPALVWSNNSTPDKGQIKQTRTF
jgi:hypothetical protein